MTTKTEAERLADLLDENWEYHSDLDTQAAAELRRLEAANKELRLKLAEQPAPAAQQEPVAWLFQHEETGLTQCVDTQQVEWGFEKNNPRWQKIAPLYTTPQAQPAREWVGLTDVEWMNIVNKNQAWFRQRPDEVACEVAKLVEAKLREKNT